MNYPAHCDTLEKKESLLKSIADNCHEFLKRGDRFWIPYKDSTLRELLSMDYLTSFEYDYICENQIHWEEHYKTHRFSMSQAGQERFDTAYNYRDW